MSKKCDGSGRQSDRVAHGGMDSGREGVGVGVAGRQDDGDDLWAAAAFIEVASVTAKSEAVERASARVEAARWVGEITIDGPATMVGALGPMLPERECGVGSWMRAGGRADGNSREHIPRKHTGG